MSKVAKATVGLMIATILAKILGFGRELVLASSYGASMYSDAYLTAVNIPWVMFSTIGTALGTIFIPIYFDVDNSLGEKRALKFTNNAFNIVILVCILLAIICFIFAKPLVKVFAIGFKDETLKITIQFTKVLVIGIVFNGLSYIMTSYLQVKNNFTIPGLISIPKNIIIIISIILSLKFGAYIMIWGTLIGTICEFLIQLPFAFKNGYKYEPYISIRDEYLKKSIWLLGPVLIGVGVNQVNTMIDRTLASTLAEGSISALNYANKLNQFVMALFITSVSSVIYPMLSKLSNEDSKERFIKTVTKSVNSIVLLVLPISVGAIVLSTPIVRLLFQRGEFDIRATNMTAVALIMYSIGMVAFGLRDILGKVFYSLKDTKTPMINGVIAVIMNIILNFVLVKYMHLAGLALATSISAIICILLLFKELKNKIGYFGQDKIVKTTLKSMISSIIMGIVVYILYKSLINTLGSGSIIELISLFLSIGVGAIVYIIGITTLKVEEVNIIANIIKRKINEQLT